MVDYPAECGLDRHSPKAKIETFWKPLLVKDCTIEKVAQERTAIQNRLTESRLLGMLGIPIPAGPDRDYLNQGVSFGFVALYFEPQY